MATTRVTCGCGHGFQAEEAHRGLRVRCPSCKTSVAVPLPNIDPIPVATPAAGTGRRIIARIGGNPARAMNPYRVALGVMTGLSLWAFLVNFNSQFHMDGGFEDRVLATGCWVAVAVCVAGLAASHGGR